MEHNLNPKAFQYQTLMSSSLTALGVSTPVSVMSADTKAGGWNMLVRFF